MTAAISTLAKRKVQVLAVFLAVTLAKPALIRKVFRRLWRTLFGAPQSDCCNVKPSALSTKRPHPLDAAAADLGSRARNLMPLDGIRVVDFGQYIAGPLVGQLLLQQGATVVKIEPPGGPRWRSGGNEALNRGKETVYLQLGKDGKDNDIAMKMVAGADIVIENFRPGIMESFGLGPKTLRKRFPELIVVTLPGFASDDEENAGLKAYDGMIAAVTGVFTDMGLDRVLEGYNPSYSAIPQASVYAGIMAAHACVSALVSRHQHGTGDLIEVPLASALLEGLSFNALGIDLPKRYYSNRVLALNHRRANGLPLNLTRQEVLDLQEGFFRLYECKDGKFVYLVTMGHFGHVHRCLSAMGLQDEARKVCPSGNLYDSSTWTGYSEEADSKCMLEMMYLREPFSTQIRNLFKRKFLERDAKDWADTLGDKAGIPCTVVYSTKEWLHSAHAIESGLVEANNDEFRIGPIAWMKDADVASSMEAPATSAHSNSVDGLTHTVAVSERKPWLDGLKVACLCNVIAGPMVAASLARFGADVIQVLNTKPMFDPRITVQFSLLTGRGKKSILADLKSSGGKLVLENLVKWADIIVFNGIENQLEPMGLDIMNLKRIKPDIILCLLGAYAGPRLGPWSNRVGYDDIMQAALGIMDRFGDPGQPTEHAHIGTIDVVCGWTGAFACACALFRRKRLGIGGFCQTSLAAVGQYLQIPFIHDYPGRVFDEPRGKVRGANELHTCVECSNGWIFVAAVDALATSQELAAARTKLACAEIKDLVTFCKQRTCAEACARLKEVDVPAAKLSSLAERREQANPRGSFLFESFPDHPCGRSLVHPSLCAVRAEAPQSALGTSRKMGIDTKRVLGELGLADRIDEWLANGSVAEQICDEFLPT